MKTQKGEDLFREDGWFYLRDENGYQVWGKGFIRVLYNKDTDEFGKAFYEEPFLDGEF